MEAYFDVMLRTIPLETQEGALLFCTVEDYTLLTNPTLAYTRQGDVVMSVTISVMEFEGLPFCRKAGCKSQFVHAQLQTKESLSDQPIHPTGRTSVPSPP